MRCLKKWIWTVFLSLFLLPAGAQEQADTTYTFRFKTGKDMFYVPWNGNDGELARLEACVEKYKTEILGGRMPLHVDGYCCSQPTETENLAMARIRSNRVKSELIVRRELTEECFVTRNHAAEGDFVTVRLTVPVKETAVTDTDAKARCKAEAERLEAEKRAEQERLAEEQRKAEEARLAAEQQTKQAETRPLDSEQTAHSGVSGWYVGLQGGVPFGVSQFSSFGADKTRAGWTAGIHGGYRFNRVLSLEAQAAWGEVNLSSRDCCPDYWLGSDGVRYEAAMAGMQGWNYSALRSRVFVQSYAVQLNVNLLGFFPATRDGRWTLELAPRLAAIGTKATLRTIGGGQEALKGDTRRHLGAGGNVQAGYRITDHLNLGIYTGITYLTGSPLDGMPEHLHQANYIWESGLRLGWFFPTKTRKEASK